MLVSPPHHCGSAPFREQPSCSGTRRAFFTAAFRTQLSCLIKKPMNAQIPLGWRQVRIFTRSFSDQWYFDLLATFARPFETQFPSTAFFLSRYVCEEGQDYSDTDMARLPPEFWLDMGAGKKKRHLSLRFRFAVHTYEEVFLSGRLAADQRFWHHSFLDYGAISGFGDTRFYPGADATERLQRVDLVATLLYANSKLVLHAMRFDGSKWSFEENRHSENTDHHITCASILHMIKNPHGVPNGGTFPAYITEREMDGAPMKVWEI